MADHDTLLLGFGENFISHCGQKDFDTSPKKEYYDFIAVSEKGIQNKGNVSGGILICPQNASSISGISCPIAVTCGMSRKSTLSFSSVRYDEAMLAVSRRIDGKDFSLFQGDCKAKYESDLTLYENLVIDGLGLIKSCKE